MHEQHVVMLLDNLRLFRYKKNTFIFTIVTVCREMSKFSDNVEDKQIT